MEYATGRERWTFDGQKIEEFPGERIILNNEDDENHPEDNELGLKEQYTYNDSNNNTHTIVFYDDMSGSTLTIDDTIQDFSDGNQYQLGDKSYQVYRRCKNCYSGVDICKLILVTERNNFNSDLHTDIIQEIISSNYPRQMSSNPLYDNQKAINISSKTDIINSAYMNTSKHLKARTNRIGGELKMSYFHNLTDHVVLGVDVCGTLNQKAKKNIDINKLNYATTPPTVESENKEYMIYYTDSHDLYATYKGSVFTGTKVGNMPYDINLNAPKTSSDSIDRFFETAYDENGIFHIPQRQYTIESVSSSETQIDTSQYLQISHEKGGDVSFEKNKFNSRAAVVLGAQYKGWFAGVRGGVSYNQGKLHVKDSTGTSSEEVSFASPFVGVHLMKSVNMKGLENGHIYVTADVNVQNKQNLKMKGIKNFRQNSVNVSLGMTWQIN